MKNKTIHDFLKQPFFTENKEYLLDAKQFDECYTFNLEKAEGRVYLAYNLTSQNYNSLNDSIFNIDLEHTQKFITKLVQELLKLDVAHYKPKTKTEKPKNSELLAEDGNVFSDRAISNQLGNVLKVAFNYYTKKLEEQGWKKIFITEKNSRPSNEFIFSFKVYKPNAQHKSEEKQFLEAQVRITRLKMQNVLNTIINLLKRINVDKDGNLNTNFALSLFAPTNTTIKEIFATVNKFNWFDENAFKRNTYKRVPIDELDD